MSALRRTSPDRAHLLDYLRVLLKRLWIVVGFFVIVVGVVGFATHRATPMYRATAVINVRPPSMILGTVDTSGLLQSVNQSQLYFNTQYALLAQRSTMEKMVTQKGLEKWPEFAGKGTAEIAREVARKVEVRPRRDTTLVDVSIVDSRREVVHRVCNALVETFSELQARQAKSSLEDSLNSLETKWMDYRNKADLKNNEISKLMEGHDTDRETFLTQIEAVREQLGEVQDALFEVDLNLAKRKSLYDQISKAVEGGSAEGLKELYNHPVMLEYERVQTLEKDLLLRQRDLERTAKEYGPDSKPVKALEKEIEDLQALLEREKRLTLLAIHNEHQSQLEVRNMYADRVQQLKEQFRELSGVKRSYDALTADVERYDVEAQRNYALWEKVQASRQDDFKPVTIEERAHQPFAPFKPDKQLNMILAVVFGLFGGIGLAFFLEYLDDTVKTKEELEKITDIPLFGVIPHISAGRRDVLKKDLYAHQQPKSTIAEAFRGVRTALSYSSQRKMNRVFLVTSSGPKEGKTTISINTAIVMAYSGTRTLLVDADLRRPRLHRSFDLNNLRGLTNLLVDDVEVKDVVQASGVDKLDILPSGPIPPNPSELLGRERMAEILEQMKEHYDRILLDTPPIGAVTDAAVLARMVDSVILVVHAGRTRKKLIERGLEQLAQIDVDVSGIVLNNLKIGRRRFYPGYYHYYYYYSTYYGDGEGRGKNKKQKAKSK